MDEQPTALDVLEGVFYFAREFSFGEECLHTTLFELKGEHPELLGDFGFDMDRPFPYCEKIGFGLLTMLGSGHLYWETNKAGSAYKADNRMFEHFETMVRNKFSQDKLVELGKIAKKLTA